MRFRDYKLEKPRIKYWTQGEYDECVRRDFLDDRTTLLRDGGLFCLSLHGIECPRHWTKAEYNEKVELGFLCKQGVFLYRGELVEMPVMSYLHARCCQRINYWLFDTFQSEEFEIRIRCPFEVPGESMPEPDGALVTPIQLKRRPHPNAAALIVEVSEESSQMERERAFDYAAALVPDYWIINGYAREIEIYRNPVADQLSGTGFKYSSHLIANESDGLSPLARPEAIVKVAELVATK